MTDYGNLCNYLTPYIVEFRQSPTRCELEVNIIYEQITCKNTAKNVKNKEILDFLELFDIIAPWGLIGTICNQSGPHKW